MIRDTLILAWHAIAWHRARTVILALCLAVALGLPMSVHGLVGMLERQMLARAEATPLVIGAPGSRFDLVLHALSFRTQPPASFTQAERFALDEAGHGLVIPLFVRYEARGHPVVGTTLDYLAFRGLHVARGKPMTIPGDAVVGAAVAERLALDPGDHLASDPENVFDLGGSYPLNMRVTGVLAPCRCPDDDAVFVDLKTAWIIEGIGHGHDDLAGADDDTLLERDEQAVVASAAIEMHTTITPENLHTFHFHGDPADRPLTALIAVPEDDRARAMLLARYVGDDAAHQALRPTAVVEELLGMIVQLRRFFDVHHALLLGVTGAFMGLVVALSLRLRRDELRTMHWLGAARARIAMIHVAELAMVLALSAGLALAGTWLILMMGRHWLMGLIAGG